MVIWTVLAWILIVYGAVLLFSGFTKGAFMMKMVKQKFGKNVDDKKAAKIMYGFGLLLIAAGIVLLFIL